MAIHMFYIGKNIHHISTNKKLIIIFILGLTIRLFLNIIFQGIDSPPDPDMGPDHIDYDLLAQNLAFGKGFTKNSIPTTMRPPGVSFLLFPIYFIFGVKYYIVRILFCILGASTCILVFFICKEITNEIIAIWSSLLLSIYPMHFYYSSHLLSEVPWGFFMTLSIWLLIIYEKKDKIVYAILMGIALAMSSYIRPIALLYLPIYIILIFIYNKHNPKKTLKIAIYPLLFMLITLFPWILRNYMITNHIILISTHGGITFLGANNETILNDKSKIGGWIPPSNLKQWEKIQNIKKPYYKDKASYKWGLNFIQNNIKKLYKLEIMKIYRLLTPIYGTPNKIFNIVGGVVWGVLFPFFGVGLLVTLKNRLFTPLHAVLVLTIFITLIFYGSHRFRAAISPYLIIYASVGGAYLINIIGEFFCAMGMYYGDNRK